MALPAQLLAMGKAADVIRAGWAAVDTLNKIVPQLEDEVSVEVRGQPGTTKQQLYFLALATANGMVRRFDSLTNVWAPSQGLLMIEYDAADNWVRCTIRYKWSCLSATTVRIDNLPAPGSWFDNVAVYRGPQCNVVGGTFDFTNAALVTPGIPAAGTPGVPVLPFRNQMILTGCPTTEEPSPSPISQAPVPSQPLTIRGVTVASPNPKPPGDNRSRGNVVSNFNMLSTPPTPGGTLPNPPTRPTIDPLCCDKLMGLVPLVFAALSQGATNADTTYPAPVAGPRGF